MKARWIMIGPEKAWLARGAVLLVALHLFVSFLAANPMGHSLWHADANGPDHNCAIKSVTAGELLLVVAAPPMPCLPSRLAPLVRAPIFPPFSLDLRLPNGRAPPLD
jgi:hypothetical protein